MYSIKIIDGIFSLSLYISLFLMHDQIKLHDPPIRLLFPFSHTPDRIAILYAWMIIIEGILQQKQRRFGIKEGLLARCILKWFF